MPDDATDTPVEDEQEQAEEHESTVEEQAVERDGQKFVPLGVVTELREKRRQAEARLKELEPTSQEAERLRQFAAQATPILKALQSRPDIIQQLTGGAEPTKRGEHTESDDPELVELAKTLDLYDASGKPDVTRAARIAEFTANRVKAGVEESVGPDRQSRIDEKAQQHYAFMVGWKDPATGKGIDKNIIDNIVNRTSREDLANVDYANNLLMMAYGAQQLASASKRKVPPVGSEPLHVDTSGGAGGTVTLTDRQKKLASEMGVSEKDALGYIKKAVDADGVIE